MALFSEKTWDDWIDEYESAHQNPRNKLCHRLGIPMIAVSIILVLLTPLWHSTAYIALALFLIGWVLQFIGHYFEQKPPEFFRDWRFLFVGLRWWIKQYMG